MFCCLGTMTTPVLVRPQPLRNDALVVAAYVTVGSAGLSTVPGDAVVHWSVSRTVLPRQYMGQLSGRFTSCGDGSGGGNGGNGEWWMRGRARGGVTGRQSAKAVRRPWLACHRPQLRRSCMGRLAGHKEGCASSLPTIPSLHPSHPLPPLHNGRRQRPRRQRPRRPCPRRRSQPDGRVGSKRRRGRRQW